MTDPAAPLLLPRPVHLTMTGGTVVAPAACPVFLQDPLEDELSGLSPRLRAAGERSEARLLCAHDAALAPEGYSLRIAPPPARGPARHSATLRASTAAGMRHGLRTVAQLLRQYGANIPCIRVEDEPAFAVRGVMLDVSRDRIPTMAQLRETVDLLASLKINHLQLYTEHTFAYAGHEEAWRGWSPITPGEARQLDAWCRARGIELAANQNCFGHLSSWLKHPEYAPLAETHGDWVFENAHESFPRSGPFSLCPIDPGSIALIDDLLGRLLPCFTSPLVNIGCDETFDVGFGRSKEAVQERGRAAVYFEFVRKIAAVCSRLGKRPMFWADIALSHPESLALMPEGMIGLAWGYEPDAPFAEWCRAVRSAGREVWVCPGTSSWRSIIGRTSERRANLRAAAGDGARGGASGFLVTDWGDTGHHQQWPVALAGIAEAADAAWTADHGRGYDAAAAGLHAFGDSTGETGRWLDRLGDVDAEMRRIGGRVAEGQAATHLRNSSVFFNDLHLPIGPGGDDKLRRGILGTPASMWHEAFARLESLAAERPAGGGALVAQELDHTLEGARVACDRALWRRERRGSARELASRIQSLIAEHRRLWLLRCREGGLDNSCRHYQKILDELRTLAP